MNDAEWMDSLCKYFEIFYALASAMLPPCSPPQAMIVNWQTFSLIVLSENTDFGYCTFVECSYRIHQ